MCTPTVHFLGVGLGYELKIHVVIVRVMTQEGFGETYCVCSPKLKSRLGNEPWSLSSAIWTCDKVFGICTPLYLETKASSIRFVMRHFTLFRPTAYLTSVASFWLAQSFSCRPDFCGHIRRMRRVWRGLGLDFFSKWGIQLHLNLFWRSYYASVYYTICWTSVLKCDMITVTRSVSFTGSCSLSFHRTWWSSTWNPCWIFWRSQVQISTWRLDVLIEVYRSFLQTLQENTGLVPHIMQESPNLTSLVRWLRWTLSNGPNRAGVSPLTYGR